MTLTARVKQLKSIEKKQLPDAIRNIAKGATMRAVEKAIEETPPTSGGGASGTNTRTGMLKQHWATDSKTAPVLRGNNYETELANNMEYASYVNDGHRMDRHFVPGLYVNEGSGMIEYDPGKKDTVGMVVGTQTKYVQGLFMADKAKEEYSRVVKLEAAKLGVIIT